MPLRIGTPMPELTGATEWLNGEVKNKDLAGKPTLVHFWSASCHICHDNMPKVAEWRDKYKEAGLQVVAVHMPREQDETDVEMVKREVTAMHITEPCAIDNLHAMGEKFQNQFWPAYFLFDAEGNMRSRSAGDAGIKMLEGALQRIMEPEAA